MEAEKRIPLTTKTVFVLSHEERRTLYTYLALSQYRRLRNPDYDADQLLKLLSKDLRSFLKESKGLMEQMPNNYGIRRIYDFFDRHHSQLKHILEKEEGA